MSTQSQIDANRRNSQLSTGPQTAAGKMASSANSFRHGLAGAKVVLPHEDPAAFEELKDSLLDEYKSTGPIERELICLLAAAMWRLQRAQRVEALYLEQTLGESSSDEALAALISSTNDQGFSKIERYRAQAERAFYRALNEVRRAQDARRREEVAAAKKQTAAAKQWEADFDRMLLEYGNTGLPPHLKLQHPSDAPAEIGFVSSGATGR